MTDSKGVYYLPSDLARSKYVSISVPAGYQIPSENGIANGYYSKLTSGPEVNERNFVLKKRTAPLTDFVYLAISDPQVKMRNMWSVLMPKPFPTLREQLPNMPVKKFMEWLWAILYLM
ncbi:MAG: hypothetical protein HC830_02055 [Bacteroidetes bacterium]|nr:hypothetical protein [Bacteroidota bacterium]